MAHSCTQFFHRRGPPTRTQAGSKRGKRPRIQRRPRARVPALASQPGPCPAPGHCSVGPAHERPMGSSQEEGLPCQPSQPDHDTGGHGGPDLEEAGRVSATPGPPGLLTSHPPADSDDTDATGPPAALLEGLLLGDGKPSPHSTRPGPFFYIGGNNGAPYTTSSVHFQPRTTQLFPLGTAVHPVASFHQNSRVQLGTVAHACNPSTVGGRAGPSAQALCPLGCRLGRDTAAPTLEDLPWTSPGHLRPQRVLRMEEFFPETYRLDLKHEREAFSTLFDGERLLAGHQAGLGRGVRGRRTGQPRGSAQQPRCGALRYIQNPLLLDGRKFDVRSYLLIACTTPYMIFFSHGYARLTLSLYDPHSSDLSGHLTNQFMQKKSPLYALLKEDTVWSMEHLNRYINTTFWKARGLPKDWVFTTLTKRMQQIMAHCFLAAKSKLECKLGYFDLIGCDFLIDDNFKVWLLEMNSNPALHTNCEVLKEVIPGVVIETLGEPSKPPPHTPTACPVLNAHPPSSQWCDLSSLQPPPPGRQQSSGLPASQLPGPTPDPDSAHDGQPQAPGKEHSGTGDRHPEQEPSPGTAKEERKEPENARP
uniref:Tubulin tyrosine ligase like 10 n=1 Tax=Mandrillus leucophaeus TaxID=9568 RepID=A0A2K5YYV5_MANLE